MQVSLQYATEHLDELALAAENGVDVEIARPERPTLKLVVSPVPVITEKSGRNLVGALRGQILVPTEAEWQKMDEELADLMTNSPIFPGH